ncbi:protein mono-ADP-ribosyltransferase PARP10 isoform X1 [Cricetulus griseus]|uniref:Poly [ADP-ribose] polymerase n=2 Tax=Cricetulus griseus TaxID=10029 RepID=A0A9J7FIG5_CRIGR|nr:protein mono-ADP-ribosyltransferase PARP10 isoform X1 [Cricetulus griseus]XP_016833733.1 protein mono-ADP-ribosyltransferase PARP10 isoform X1 [Cricetulus griseus]XP_027259994.1 protein mono-ADP-ribosyltransferase PARP10 isoform X1 [Cricetulus griseus]XP_027259995.1 protein mono-ADP-ribosyltransferase PARP10 isoform X1 [Cricetulus griseus]ERE81352.1 poly [ADP-ribose] polymerase 10-like protein [Cricetulus griseus]
MAEVEAGAAVELWGLLPEVSDELLTLYFENHRRSGGGPLLSWQRIGCGGILTFQDPADAKRVLSQAEHQLSGVRLSLRPAPPRAPERLLLQQLPPDTSPLSLEQHVQALLCAIGHPMQACHALASPRQDCALVQLSMPLSEAEVCALEEQACNMPLNGVTVSLSWVPQTRAVRVVNSAVPVDLLLLELYLENERRSGGGPLEDVRSLPRQLGTVITFQQWQVAERVLKRKHWLQGSELSLVPHYDVLEPEQLAEGMTGGDHPTMWESGAVEHALLDIVGLAGAPTMTVSSGETSGQLGACLRTGPVGAPEQAMPVDLEPVTSLEQEEPINLGTVGSPEQDDFMNEGTMVFSSPVGPAESFTGSLGQGGSMASSSMGVQRQEGLEEVATGSPGQEGLMGLVGMATESPERELESPGHGGLQRQEGLVEIVMSMDPGAMRFLQLYYEDLLASLEDVALFPLEGVDVTGFRLCGPRAPCQAAQELLQSLLGSISCHTLDVKYPGSAKFLLGVEGQHLLHGLEAQFQCVFGTEHLASAILDIDPERMDPTEALQVLHGHSTDSDEDNMRLEEVQELLATLKGLHGKDWLPLEMEKEKPGEQPEEITLEQEEEKPTLETGDEPTALSTGIPRLLEEEATLQLAIHRSLESQGQVAEQQEATTLRRALALSLLEAEKPLDEDTGGRAQLVVHISFEQDMDEVDRALSAALEVHLQEETVSLQGRTLPSELGARLERCHDVSITLHGDRIILRGFGVQPAQAARHLAALLIGPWDQNLTFPLEASNNNLSEQELKEPLGRLEALEEKSKEFQDVVQAFYDTLDAAHSRIQIVRVERVSHPLLQQQYQLHRERLMQCCQQRPVEQVLYHGTSESAVLDICAHGFNRSFCGRNGTLYGQGVYFAKRASLSVLDRYSPPNTEGHKAVFVARVLTGDYGQGARGLKAPPLRASGQVLRYDSAVDCLQQPRIFVIFHDTQALPTHLITCKNISRDTP